MKNNNVISSLLNCSWLSVLFCVKQHLKTPRSFSCCAKASKKNNPKAYQKRCETHWKQTKSHQAAAQRRSDAISLTKQIACGAFVLWSATKKIFVTSSRTVFGAGNVQSEHATATGQACVSVSRFETRARLGYMRVIYSGSSRLSRCTTSKLAYYVNRFGRFCSHSRQFRAKSHMKASFWKLKLLESASVLYATAISENLDLRNWSVKPTNAQPKLLCKLSHSHLNFGSKFWNSIRHTVWLYAQSGSLTSHMRQKKTHKRQCKVISANVRSQNWPAKVMNIWA
jgi:hypothetical protein